MAVSDKIDRAQRKVLEKATWARRKALEDAGFLAFDFVVDGKTKRVIMTRYLYDPVLIEEVRAERAEFPSAQGDDD